MATTFIKTELKVIFASINTFETHYTASFVWEKDSKNARFDNQREKNEKKNLLNKILLYFMKRVLNMFLNKYEFFISVFFSSE